MFIEFFERGGIENIRARFRPIERQHANAVVDLALNHRAGERFGHGDGQNDSKRFLDFARNDKRGEGGSTAPRAMLLSLRLRRLNPASSDGALDPPVKHCAHPSTMLKLGGASRVDYGR